jgi:hypothetical protein
VYAVIGRFDLPGICIDENDREFAWCWMYLLWQFVFLMLADTDWQMVAALQIVLS